MILRRVTPAEVRKAAPRPPDQATRAEAARIVDDVRERGEAALLDHAVRLGDLEQGERLTWSRPELDAAATRVPRDVRALLERTAERIRAFAEGQRRSVSEVEMAVPGGRAGQRVSPVESAGCYAPGGRYPLPSSVLMTVVTARAAGVETIWVASPRPAPVTLAAAAVAGADGLLACGGAHAIAALAFGAGPVPACDLVVGPGNRWVTAAKQHVSGEVGIDMLAGPSELVVLADETATAAVIAADLLAQAEHDPDAVPMLVTTSDGLAASVEAELEEQLRSLPTAATARAALANGFAVVAPTLEAAVEASNRLAPEHLEVMTRDSRAVAARLRHYGALFVGGHTAEVLGDYGAGPNHVLPTSSTARFTGGLSVLTFLRVHTWLQVEPGAEAAALARDAAALARLEGLEAHARSAERRL